ncbi:hypothetical protein T11_16628 [Trichinella zimbabwensis]|uniref:Uncharacterized protein n=1 Tax=Trichinella zimbabwensis TaxID=268475 RepID=A0A0V1F2J9_9BILA|nr:hypothetical protein T11_16628 [Trichinella zimbabwensis]
MVIQFIGVYNSNQEGFSTFLIIIYNYKLPFCLYSIHFKQPVSQK